MNSIYLSLLVMIVRGLYIIHYICSVQEELIIVCLRDIL